MGREFRGEREGLSITLYVPATRPIDCTRSALD
jgi:hypothetical protein